MEFCESGDLKSFIEKELIQNNKNVDEKLVWKWIYQISSALSYIHSKNIIHRDMKPQ